MGKPSNPQAMKPETAAKKLGVFLPATPAEFQEGSVTRDELNDLLAHPPQWLVDLRLHGPHPKQEVARKLGISSSGLARAQVKDASCYSSPSPPQRPHSTTGYRCAQPRLRNRLRRVSNLLASKCPS